MTKLMKICLSISLFSSILLGWVVFMAADNQPPYEYDAENSYVIPAIANDGDQIRVMWKIKKINRICPGSNSRVLFDPSNGVIIAAYDPTPAAFSGSIRDGYLNRTFLLPRALQSGPIGYRATVCYECNPFQKFVKPLCITTPDLFFSIK